MLRQSTCAILLLALICSNSHAATQAKKQANSRKKQQDKLIVILDPGHGGDDAGARREHEGNLVEEKNITLSIAKHAQSILKSRGIRAILTRWNDDFVDLDKRTSIANRAALLTKKSVFVSIHANSNDDPRSSGIETYVFNAASNEASKRLADLENGHRFEQSHGTLDLIFSDLATTANFSESVKLACGIQRSVVSHLEKSDQPIRDRGVRQALFYVLMQTRMPSILFEPGFISNPHELAKLTDANYQRLLARSLVDGIIRWKNAEAQIDGSSKDVAINSVSAINKASSLCRF